MFNLRLVITHLQADLLIFLSLRVKHADFELPICGLRIVPVLPDGPNDLFPLVHGIDSKLQQVLLIHLDQVHPGDVMFLNQALHLILPRISQSLCEEADDLFDAPFHDVGATPRLDYGFRAIYGLVPIRCRPCHDR
jgi:hypothetical protein